MRHPILAGPAAGQSYPCPPGSGGHLRVPRMTGTGYVVDLYVLRKVVIPGQKGVPAVAYLEAWVPGWWPLTGPVPGLEIRQL